MLTKRTKYKKELIYLYNEFMKYKIYDKNRCTLCESCLHGKEYNEETEIFKELKKRMGSFFECKNPKARIGNTLKYNCNLFTKSN